MSLGIDPTQTFEGLNLLVNHTLLLLGVVAVFLLVLTVVFSVQGNSSHPSRTDPPSLDSFDTPRSGETPQQTSEKVLGIRKERLRGGLIALALTASIISVATLLALVLFA